MGKAERLKLLFGDEASLLQMDTYLNVPTASVSTTEITEPQKDAAPEKQNEEPVQVPVETEPKSNPVYISDKVKKEQRQESTITEINPGQDVVNPSGSFCPLIAVSRYPYRFIHGELSQRVSSKFFDQGKFWKRSWDLYYLLVPPHIGIRPLLLVPTNQVEQLLKEINHTLEASCSIPSVSGFVLDFQVGALPRPGFLGQSTSREMKDYLESQIATMPYHGESLDPAIPEHQAFKEKLEEAVKMTKNKKAASKAKKEQVRVQTEHHWIRCLKRTQSYFGLRAVYNEGEEQYDDRTGVEPGANGMEPALNIHKPVPYPCLNEPVFISVDVESNERCHSQVTEIGISVLDTRDLVNTPPGETATNWTTNLRSRHFRVKEYSHVVNHDFIPGYPDRFEFGDSEWASLSELPTLIETCFQHYLSQQRNLVLVGHNPSVDVRYLHDLGVPLFQDLQHSPSVFLETVDTAEVFRVSRHELTVRSLGNILAAFGVTGWYLHNAGNDARYTIEAMVLCLFQSLPGSLVPVSS